MKLIRFVPFVRRLFGWRKVVVKITFKSGSTRRFVMVGNKDDIDTLQIILARIKDVIQENGYGVFSLNKRQCMIVRIQDVVCISTHIALY